MHKVKASGRYVATGGTEKKWAFTLYLDNQEAPLRDAVRLARGKLTRTTPDFQYISYQQITEMDGVMNKRKIGGVDNLLVLAKSTLLELAEDETELRKEDLLGLTVRQIVNLIHEEVEAEAKRDEKTAPPTDLNPDGDTSGEPVAPNEGMGAGVTTEAAKVVPTTVTSPPAAKPQTKAEKQEAANIKRAATIARKKAEKEKEKANAGASINTNLDDL